MLRCVYTLCGETSDAIHFQRKERERSGVGEGPLSDASVGEGAEQGGTKAELYSNPPR